MKSLKKLYTFLAIWLTVSCWSNIVNAQISMPDAKLAAVVRKKLRMPPDASITRNALEKLTDLNAQGSRVEEVTGSPFKITDLTGLEHAIRLERLSINDNSISDLTPLGTLTRLKQVDANGNAIKDLTPLRKLTQLEWLSINNNNISDLTPLEKMTQLKGLYISGNPISNLMPLEKMTRLEALDISGYGLSNITMLKKLTKLERLYISHNAISDIMPLANLSPLKILDLRNNEIIDVSPLSKLNNLKRLKLGGNAIVDVSPLAKLNNLEQLDLQDNAIIDISPLTTLKNTSFSLDGNLITVNFPLTPNGIVLESETFIVLSRNQSHSMLRNKVKIIYPDWAAFIQANPVILNSPKNRRNSGNILRTLVERIDDTLNSFRSDGQGGTIELIAHPRTKANFGDIIISEIMWGRHETPSDNQWIEFYSPKKRFTLANNRFALLFTGTYLDREVIPSTQSYAGWKVIDRVRNAGSQQNLAWQLPENSWGTQASEFPVSMSRAIDYDTGIAPDGSLEDSWTASNNQENLSTGYGSPGASGKPKVLIPAAQRPPIYWIDEAFGRLQLLTDDQVEDVGITTQNATDFAVDTIGGKVYWTEKTGDTTGKIHRANLDGSEVEELKSLSTSVPLRIAVDNKGNKLYWTNSNGKIQRSNLNGKIVKTILQNLNSPKEIDLDIAGGKIYWTEPGSIWRVDLNGKNPEELVPGLQEIVSIAVADSYIYWVEKIKANLEVVKRVPLAGTNPKEILSVENVAFKDITVDSVGKKLYWIDSRGRIQRANLNGSWIQSVVTGLAPHTHLALGVLAPKDSTAQKDPLPTSLENAKVLVPAAQRPPMYWIDTDSGMLQHLTNTQAQNVGINTQNVTDLTVDPASGKVYWTEKTGDTTGKIHRANLDGSEVEEVKSFSANVPLSIAVDSNGNKLYWTNSRGKIQRSNLNGQSVKALLQNLNSPTGINVDIAGGKIYWTESGSIWRANLNGKRPEELVPGLQEVGSVAIADRHIYWTEKIGKALGGVKRANLDGTNPEDIISIRNVAFKDLAIDSVGKKLYWTDSRGRIRRANLNGSRIQNVVTGLATPTHLVLNVLAFENPAAPNSTSLALLQSPAAAPEETDLLTNYPNPFNPETWIPYHLAKPADVRLTIYGIDGKVVRHLDLGHQAAGFYQSKSRAAHWDGRNNVGERVASGIYFYTLIAGDFSATKKMLILK